MFHYIHIRLIIHCLPAVIKACLLIYMSSIRSDSLPLLLYYWMVQTVMHHEK